MSTIKDALEPFAAFAKDNVDDDGWISKVGNDRIVCWFGPSDFRRAASALADIEGAGKDEKERNDLILALSYLPLSNANGGTDNIVSNKFDAATLVRRARNLLAGKESAK